LSPTKNRVIRSSGINPCGAQVLPTRHALTGTRWSQAQNYGTRSVCPHRFGTAWCLCRAPRTSRQRVVPSLRHPNGPFRPVPPERHRQPSGSLPTCSSTRSMKHNSPSYGRYRHRLTVRQRPDISAIPRQPVRAYPAGYSVVVELAASTGSSWSPCDSTSSSTIPVFVSSTCLGLPVGLRFR